MQLHLGMVVHQIDPHRQTGNLFGISPAASQTARIRSFLPCSCSRSWISRAVLTSLRLASKAVIRSQPCEQRQPVRHLQGAVAHMGLGHLQGRLHDLGPHPGQMDGDKAVAGRSQERDR